MSRDERQVRSVASNFITREDGEDLRIEGHFAVFNSDYLIADGLSESVAPGAFTDTLAGDVRALIDHDTRLVLGRTKAGTLELREDDKGLWGSIKINRNDVDAMNLYARVQRRDVDQCSFGFFPLEEKTEKRDDGSIHWTITKADLREVSCCTFPAYQETNISARKADAALIRKREADAWKLRQKERLEEIRHGVKSADDEEKD